VALVNSTTETLKKTRLRVKTDGACFGFYDIQPGNRVSLFFQPRSQHRADELCN